MFVAGGGLPEWATTLPFVLPVLFPFELREALLRCAGDGSERRSATLQHTSYLCEVL